MPEREENDGLDGEELDDRVEGPEELPGGEVEKEQGVQGSRDTRYRMGIHKQNYMRNLKGLFSYYSLVTCRFCLNLDNYVTF